VARYPNWENRNSAPLESSFLCIHRSSVSIEKAQRAKGRGRVGNGGGRGFLDVEKRERITGKC
jgi:hypothetical protein